MSAVKAATARATKASLTSDGEVWVYWIVRGEAGAVSFCVLFGKRDPLPFGIDIHYNEQPEHDEWVGGPQDCAFTQSGRCWTDGSVLAASELYDRLCATPDQSIIWSTLEDWYADKLGSE